jgi:hypothetical protein
MCPSPEAGKAADDKKRFALLMITLVVLLFFGFVLLGVGAFLDFKRPEVPPPFQDQRESQSPPTEPAG